MSTPVFQFLTKTPKDCSERELADFECVVRAGGEVSGAGLSDGIRRAVALVFMTRDGKLQGVAGLKSPAASYRTKISEKSGVPLPVTNLPFEIGWVHIVAEAQGNKQTRPLMNAAMAPAGGVGIFATSRKSKGAIHHVLTTEGFVRTGKHYSAADGQEDLLLFVRKSTVKPGGPVAGIDLMKDLNVAMLSIYQRSLRDTGVNHSLFHQMITERGAHATALFLVHAPKPSEGYTDLYIRKRLDLTVEALVLEPKWVPIFSEETRQRARKRLTEYQFDFAKHGL